MYLADTHVFLFWMGTPERLSPRVRNIIEDESDSVFFSTASLWEIVIKHGIGKLSGVEPEEVLPSVRNQGWRILDIKASHILGLRALPTIHADPFDRLLVAQAIEEDLALLSRDPLVARYPLRVVWG